MINALKPIAKELAKEFGKAAGTAIAGVLVDLVLVEMNKRVRRV